jgi:hypothetical protein
MAADAAVTAIAGMRSVIGAGEHCGAGERSNAVDDHGQIVTTGAGAFDVDVQVVACGRDARVQRRCDELGRFDAAEVPGYLDGSSNRASSS